MEYLMDVAIDVTKNYAHDDQADVDLESMCYIGVLAVDDGRAINVLLPSSLGDAPAMARIVVGNDGIVEHDIDDADDEEVADTLIAAAIESRQRLVFCEEALHNMGIAPEDVAHLLRG